MHYVYILQTEYNDETYIGCTNDLQKRIVEHNSGKVSSTKKKIPYTLIHYEAFLNQQDAFAREQFLKQGGVRSLSRKI